MKSVHLIIAISIMIGSTYTLTMLLIQVWIEVDKFIKTKRIKK